MLWIGLAPNIIMGNLKLPMINYAIYQLIAVGGLSLSTIIMQLVAGRVKISRLIKVGNLFAFGGLAIGLIFSKNLNIVVMGMLLYSFGLGISNSLIMRLVMTAAGLSQSMLTSLLIFIQTTIFAIGISAANNFCSYYHYSLYSFTLLSFSIACLFSILAIVYAHMNMGRSWN
ncbi:MAG: hypothetical protein K0R14_2187 [Burkholderiales bacterium]|jgi:hypothetical protein|nr:hypothetical protein [Burkholderiales bacterium]